MRSSHSILLIALVLVCGLSAAAQTAPKIFDRNGSHFIYPDGWSFEDASNNNSEELTFGRSDMDVQLKVSLFKTPLTTPEKLAEAKKILVDRYIDATVKSFESAGGKPVSKPATSEIAGVASQGISVTASLDGVPGAISIQWAVVSERMVVMTLLGPSSDVKMATPAWDMIRTTLKIEPPPPTPVATPTPKKPTD